MLTSRRDGSQAIRNWRTTETRLAKLSLWALAIFLPVETYASYVFAESGARFLIHPGYLHSVAGMVLLFVGARHSLKARPRSAPGLLCASHAWWAATSWTSTQLRIEALARSEQMRLGAGEFWFVIVGTGLAFACFALSLFLTYRSTFHQTASAASASD
jgi:hypothetical protein